MEYNIKNYFRASLRLLVTFIHYIYPPLTPVNSSSGVAGGGKDAGSNSNPAILGKTVSETQKLAECVYEVRCQLVAVLSDPLPAETAKLKRVGGQHPVNLRKENR